jgi:hypothetical protein
MPRPTNEGNQSLYSSIKKLNPLMAPNAENSKGNESANNSAKFSDQLNDFFSKPGDDVKDIYNDSNSSQA